MKEIREVPHICRMCTASCSVIMEVMDGEVVRIRGNPNAIYHNDGRICPRGNSGIYLQDMPSRLTKPLIRNGGRRGEWNFRESSYQEALSIVANEIRMLKEKGESNKVVVILGQAIAARHNPEVVGALSKALGTPNVIVMPLSTCIGSKLVAWGFSGVPGHHAYLVPDYKRTRFYLSFGRNLGGSVAVGQTRKAGIGKRKYELVVVDPRLSEWAIVADKWIPIRPGTDLALLLALINVILNEKLYDEEYLIKYTNAPMLVNPTTLEPIETKEVKLKNPMKEFSAIDFLVYDEASESFKFSREAKLPSLYFEGDYNGVKVTTVFNVLRKHVEEYTPEWAEEVTGVPASVIRDLAKEMGSVKPVSIEPGWSANKFYNHFQTYRAAAVLSILLGSLLRRGGVVLSMGGITTVLQRGSPPVAGPPVSDKPSDLWSQENETEIELSDGTKTKGPLLPWGRNYFGLLKLIEKERGWVILVLGGNPARTMMGEAFQKIARSKNVNLIFDFGLLKDDTVLYSDVFIPECSYLERPNQVSGIPFSLAKGFMVGGQALDSDCKAFHEFVLDLLKEVDSNAIEAYARGVAKAICPACEEELVEVAKKYSGEKHFFTNELIKLQCEKMGINYNDIMKNGIVYQTSEEWGLEMNEKILTNGWLNTASGKVEILPLKLLNLIKKRKGEIKPEWHPLPTWVPPLWMRGALGKDEFVATTGKLRNMSYTSTQDNPVLAYLLDDTGIWINKARAKELGIENGDLIEVCSEWGCVRGPAKVTNAIEPTTVFIPANYGFEVDLPFAKYKYLALNKLQTPYHIDPITGTHLLVDFKVKVKKVM
ncbi:hypothetical protein EYM_00785 [Ignicoccus islandicus DSM 13165]|uniref:4Fe-4S Mo/W bis-MGD-type domain-containing protein n=1 Tax=Ignicoccus islandicus DSM 13165 TaxID=940295 RepID=A0A0U2MAD2_9CREN|nr:molybdopterin-dependent oxidoreductase [Ignicoccus islandicus]ALU12141.1 hypothetical protein EYM_00785 [Ignicoccus islandicus DSM 13165]